MKEKKDMELEEKVNAKKKNEEDCEDMLVFRDDITRNKVKKHMSDINDKITDEDIRNVKTDVTPNVSVNSCDDEEMPPLREEVGKKAFKDDPNSPDVQSPWNIID